MEAARETVAEAAAAYMTVQAACAMASISRCTFYRLLNNPDTGLDKFVFRLPGIQRLRVPREEFIAWLRSGPPIHRRRRSRAFR